MNNEEDFKRITDKINENEILKFRENCQSDKEINDYLFKNFQKIFKKLAFPYFRFEILLNCIEDIKTNKIYYSNLKNMAKINDIYEKLQKITLYMNIALDEYNNLISYIEKP
ncbi:hypothetical protein IJI31_05010 [bacterium]|nr:hypothetical protein [bacterium]